MSLISCTAPCVYQQDGRCALSRAASCGTPGNCAQCVNFVPRSFLQNSAQGLPDIADTNDLQSLRNS